MSNSFRLAPLSILALIATAAAAVAAPQASGVPGVLAPRPAGCRYQPGSQFSAAIYVTVTDRETADTATVNLNGTIPSGGREATAGAGSRYIATLPVTPVRLARNSLKRFNLAPRLIIENPGSVDCRLRIEAVVGQRVWALDANTNFAIEARVVVGGEQQTLRTQMFVSCFDQDTKVRLASGEEVAVRELVSGDMVWNPIGKHPVRVAEVIQGTEADEAMVRVGYGNTAVLFTARHPILTRKGLRTAGELTRQDAVRGEDGAFHDLTVLEPTRGNPDRLVYNLKLDAPADQPGDHLMAVGGIVVGDFVLQEAARPAELSLR